MAACEYCGADDVVEGSVCPKAIVCPRCGAGPGRRCKRPSGHLAETLHAVRVVRAEAMSRVRIRPATREDYDPPMDPPQGEMVIEDA